MQEFLAGKSRKSLIKPPEEGLKLAFSGIHLNWKYHFPQSGCDRLLGYSMNVTAFISSSMGFLDLILSIAILVSRIVI
jgi:hypothetical protein